MFQFSLALIYIEAETCMLTNNCKPAFWNNIFEWEPLEVRLHDVMIQMIIYTKQAEGISCFIIKKKTAEGNSV